MQKAPESLRPHKAHRLVPLSFVNEVTRNNATRVFDIINQCKDLSVLDTEEIKRIIEENCRNSAQNFFNLVNWEGYTFLQCSIIKNHTSLVKLLIKKGSDVNSGICSLPLHLACSLGHVDIVQMLLTFGAKADLECTVCYPGEHKLRTYPDKIYCLAYQPVYTPMTCILSGDHQNLLPLLINHENSKCQVKTEFLLHEACKTGALECAKYLMQNYSEQMLQKNTEGKTPLQISLVIDAENATFLMNNGAQIKDTVFLTNNGSTLHELYKRKVNLGLVKGTKFALEHGFRNHINMRDKDGNTALYVLLKCVGRTVRSTIQALYDREVIESIKLLLQSGANPNVLNHLGETALHVVLVDNCARQLYVSQHGQVRRLKSILQEIYKVVEILLSHGADPGAKSAAKCLSPLFYAVHIFQSLQPAMFVVVKTALKQLIFILSKSHCSMNARDSLGFTMYLHLLHTSYHWLSTNTTAVTPFCKTVFSFLISVLQHFIKHDLDPNDQMSYKLQRNDGHITTTYFREVLMFCTLELREEIIFPNVKIMLVKLIQGGFDVNYTVNSLRSQDVHGSNLPSTLQILNTILTHPTTSPSHTMEILELFSQTLNQQNYNLLSSCLGASLDLASCPDVVRDHLTKMSTNPRTLKQLCRISVGNALSWRLFKHCPSLPLPKVLLHYVHNLHV